MLKPFVKWAGGKSQIINEISKKYPEELGNKIKKYAEPFVGGGAVLFDVLSKFDLDEVYISDINRELIITYKNVRDNVRELIRILSKLENDFLKLDIDSRKKYYYEKRDLFNLLKKEKNDGIEISALFIFLNKTCFNGLYRVNKRGEFNVPIGSYKKPVICDEKNLSNVSAKLQNVFIVCGDYKESRDFIDNKTFAYFDPPYRPISATSSFTSYSQDGFDDEKQIELANFINEMSKKGASVVISNSDPKNNDDKDNFFDKLYEEHNIYRIGAMRMINSIGKGRGKISELLILTY